VVVSSGVGKSHAACSIGHALIEQGHSVLFRPAYQLVQELLAAKRDLLLPQKLRRLDSFELLILDDIGYIKQSAEEAEVLFTLIAERYERGSMLITSNLVFSDWERIFKDPMATAAAIDRLVHHAMIVEFNVPSYRTRRRRRSETEQGGSAAAG
jgi:DNA replication protein DnaC